jgi:peptide/nickel transport system permease protein
MDYVHSAKVAGFTRLRTLLSEILPNVLPTIVALLTLEMGIAVIVEAILSFVNLSISTDQPTWGGMIAEGRTSIHQAWWVLVFPLIALFFTVLSFAQFGEGLRERFDPVLR